VPSRGRGACKQEETDTDIHNNSSTTTYVTSHGKGGFIPINKIHGEGAFIPINNIHGEGAFISINKIHGEGAFIPINNIHGPGALNPINKLHCKRAWPVSRRKQVHTQQ